MPAELERHWRVVPEDELLDPISPETVVEQPRLRGHCRGFVERGRYVGNHDENILGSGSHVKGRRLAGDDGLFNEEDPVPFGKTGHQMLWPLVDEVPAQV